MIRLTSNVALKLPEVDGREQRLIEALRHEFLHVAMMTAFVTMGCNAIGKTANDDVLASIEAHVPEEPAIFRAIRQGLLDVQAQYASAVFAAQGAYDALSNAIEALAEARAQHSGRLSAVAAGHAPPQLAAHWRAACQAFLHALEVFEVNGLLRTLAQNSGSIVTQCPMRLRELLRLACRGETLEVPADPAQRGDALPEWVQQRRWDRRQINMKCTLTVRGASYAASLRNISLGGALIDGVPVIPRGTQVVVTTDQGRSLKGSVMWARDKSIGVKFDEQLMHDDPLVDN